MAAFNLSCLHLLESSLHRLADLFQITWVPTDAPISPYSVHHNMLKRCEIRLNIIMICKPHACSSCYPHHESECLPLVIWAYLVVSASPDWVALLLPTMLWCCSSHNSVFRRCLRTSSDQEDYGKQILQAIHHYLTISTRLLDCNSILPSIQNVGITKLVLERLHVLSWFHLILLSN